MLNTMDRLELELLPNHSWLSSIQDHLTYGSLINNADFPLLVISIDTSIAPRVQPTLLMELNSILPMDLELLLDSLDKIPLA